MSANYAVEGVMPVSGGWLLALDRRFDGAEGDRLTLIGLEEPVSVTVDAVIESDDGAARDIVIAPIQALHDPRLLVGRRLAATD